jgi:hypothetical protein
MFEFLDRMSSLGFEIATFTSAAKDYADRIVNDIDMNGVIQHRLYRQHAVPWGPLFLKDLSRLGRDLSRTIIIDDIADNFLLQPLNGVAICAWKADTHQDRALYNLSPLLEELVYTNARVPDFLEKYKVQLPLWVGPDHHYNRVPPPMPVTKQSIQNRWSWSDHGEISPSKHQNSGTNGRQDQHEMSPSKLPMKSSQSDKHEASESKLPMKKATSEPYRPPHKRYQQEQERSQEQDSGMAMTQSRSYQQSTNMPPTAPFMPMMMQPQPCNGPMQQGPSTVPVAQQMNGQMIMMVPVMMVPAQGAPNAQGYGQWAAPQQHSQQ